jgi:hypothetical protein
MRPILLAAGLGLMWLVLVQDGVGNGDAPAWGIAIILVARLVADFVGGWIVVSILRLFFAIGRIGLAHFRGQWRQEIS